MYESKQRKTNKSINQYTKLSFSLVFSYVFRYLKNKSEEDRFHIKIYERNDTLKIILLSYINNTIWYNGCHVDNASLRPISRF